MTPDTTILTTDPTPTATATPAPMKIIQIAIHPAGNIYGLGDDGTLYYWNTNMNIWTEAKNS